MVAEHCAGASSALLLGTAEQFAASVGFSHWSPQGLSVPPVPRDLPSPSGPECGISWCGTIPFSWVISAKPRCSRRSALEGKSFLSFSTQITWLCSVCWNSSLPVLFPPFAVPSMPVPLCHGHGEAHTSTSLCPWVGSGAVGTAGTRREAAGCS